MNVYLLWVLVAQSCQTLCNPIDGLLCQILQARIQEWVAIPFSRISYRPRDRTWVSSLQADSLLSETPRKLGTSVKDKLDTWSYCTSQQLSFHYYVFLFLFSLFCIVSFAMASSSLVFFSIMSNLPLIPSSIIFISDTVVFSSRTFIRVL